MTHQSDPDRRGGDGAARSKSEGDRFVGITGFGASARSEVLCDCFEIRVDRSIDTAREAIASGKEL